MSRSQLQRFFVSLSVQLDIEDCTVLTDDLFPFSSVQCPVELSGDFFFVKGKCWNDGTGIPCMRPCVWKTVLAVYFKFVPSIP
jgi:hypothetical protein